MRLPTLLSVILLCSTAHGGRPSRFTGATLDAAKRDWRQVQSGRLTVGDFKSRHRITNGVMTRLRRAHPQDFGHLSRERTFSRSELGRMQKDWGRIGKGEITLTQFKKTYGLGGDTYKRLMSGHGQLFPKIDIKLGGSRLAAKRRTTQHDPKRVRSLSAAWRRDVVGGKVTVSQFYKQNGTSKREITALRKLADYDGWFPSATGSVSSRRKQTLSSGQTSQLSQLWQQSVVSGQMTITAFKKQQGLTQRGYRELRQDKRAFPDPKRTPKHKGGPARRSFTAAQVNTMKADWRKVLSMEMPRATFMKKHRMHSKMFKRLRDDNPGAFPDMGGRGKTTQFSQRKLDSMKTDWLTVVAGRSRETDFRRKHNLSTTLFRRLREQLQHKQDFPKLKGKAATTASASKSVVTDWTKVTSGRLAASTFRKRHPDVRATDLVALQQQLTQAARQRPEKPAAPTIEPRKLTRLKSQWNRVLEGQMTQKALLAQVGVSEHRLKKYRKEHPGELTGPTKRVRTGSRYARAELYNSSQVTAARALFGRYHRGEIRYRTDLLPQLEKLGISRSNASLSWLRKKDPAAFGSRNTFVKNNHGAIINDLVTIARANRHVIRKWSDFLEVVAQEPAFARKWGKLNLKLESSIVRTDYEGSRKLYKVMAEVGTQMGKDSGPKGGRTVARAPSKKYPRRDSAKALAAALDGLKPTKANLDRVVARLAKTDKNFSTRRKALGVRSEYQGVYPELRRWNFDSHRAYSLRYMARWTESAHKAGPGASYERIAAIFKRSAEYKEDGRMPPKRSGTAQMALQYPELVTSWSTRRTYQRTRQLLELLRTAKQGATLYSLRGQLKKIGLSYTYAHKWLNQMSDGEAEAHGMKRSTFQQLKRGGFNGMGQRADRSFDPKAEPPGVKMDLVRDILDTPRTPPMLDYAIKRLDGKLPFQSHNVMFINHRYSDIVSLVDAMDRAGMEPKNSVFVSTPYPFKKAVSYQLRKRGVRTIVPRLDIKSYARGVELGIRRMLQTHERQRKQWGKGKPILILDDGGMASKIIAEKFPQHVSKFRIVEITAAGHRLARQFKKDYKRLPFVYYSLAYTRMKKRVTSRFFGTRVADRVLDLIPQTGKNLKNKRVAILGGGPMGIYAGIRLRKQGYDVTFVDPDPKVQRKLRWLKFKTKSIEQALPGRGIVLGMSGYCTLKPEHLKLVQDGAFVVQGSSKRKEFDMDGFTRKATSKVFLPRKDGLSQKSYTYSFGRGRSKKQLHFLGDGWTINHDGSLHGTPMRDIQFELALYFQSAVQAASTPLGRTGAFREVSTKTQREFYDQWRRITGQR